MGVEISSREELEVWLRGKPLTWAPVIALRAALRVLLVTCDPAMFNRRVIDPRKPLLVFRASTILLGANKYRAGDMTASNAVRLIIRASGVDHAAFGYAAHAIIEASGADAFAAAASSARACTNAAAAAAAANADANADALAPAPAPTYTAAAVWQSIAVDCSLLERGDTIAILLAAPLWSNELPKKLGRAWDRARAWLDASPDGFALWRDWYERKLRGERFEFAGFDDAVEREFFARLFAQDNEWWDRDPAAVNAEIASWVADLSPPKLTDADLAQNPVVINFALNAEGLTILASEPLHNGLQDGPDARDTHAEIRRLNAEARLASEHGSTQATDMVDSLDLLAEAVGAKVEDVRPRVLVLRGKELMRQFEARQRDDPMGLPLSVAQINAIAPLIEAMKQFVDEDAKLHKLWQGPDSEGPALTKRQIDVIIDALDEFGQTIPAAQEPLVIVAEQVTANAGKNDPARKTASEMVRNVFRSIGSGLKKADEGSKSAVRWINLVERATQIWTKVRHYLPDDEVISRLLDWISKGGSSG